MSTPVSLHIPGRHGPARLVDDDREKHIRHLPVTDASDVIGVVSIRDLVKAVIEDHAGADRATGKASSWVNPRYRRIPGIAMRGSHNGVCTGLHSGPHQRGSTVNVLFGTDPVAHGGPVQRSLFVIERQVIRSGHRRFPHEHDFSEHAGRLLHVLPLLSRDQAAAAVQAHPFVISRQCRRR